MERDGWSHEGGLRWKKVVKDASEVPHPWAGQTLRRVTRGAEDGALIEDLWVYPGMSDKRRSKVLKEKKDVIVEVDVCEEEEGSDDGGREPLSSKDATAFRAIAARINFMAVDRPDLQYCSKEASRCMAQPVGDDWTKLRRMGRYLLHRGRVAHLYKWQAPYDYFSVFVDSNWAGCPRTRRSTTGSAIMYGGCLLRSVSRTQSNVALSSAEAELYAMVHSASEGLGAKAMAMDFGLHISPHLYVDASAAIGIAQRKGLGEVRHLATQSLWVQDALRERRVTLEKISGTENPGDLMTKVVDSKVLQKLMDKLNLVILQGRSSIAPPC